MRAGVATALGAALLVAGVAMVCRPTSNMAAFTRSLVGDGVRRTGPSVFVDTRATHIIDREGQRLSVAAILGGAGYRVRARPEYITRDGLEWMRVLVVDRPIESLGDSRTRTLVTRWIEEGGALLILAPNQTGPTRTRLGAGRIATLDPTSLAARALILDLLEVMRWLEPSGAGLAEVKLPRS